MTKTAQSFDLSKTLDSKEEFYEFLQTLLRSGNPSGLYLIAFIYSRLKQFHLESRYEPEEILHEAICRTAVRFNETQSIEKPLGWLRSVSYNIIRELSRKDERLQLTAEYAEIEFQIMKLLLPDENSVSGELTTVITDMKRGLIPEDKKILELRVDQGMTFPQIRKQLENQGIQISDPALRKRWQRLRQRLLKELLKSDININ
ncbi:MAG: sigma-70 family RNA polymerase sigma factor [Symploca sp. SIO2D2]|nr:sigma-70 family RNA polymerase sigma factor [Symploca sp. SIO2D2]